MATNRPEELSPFGRAALALDEELERFKRLAQSLARAELDSRRDIERAARALREAGESREQLALRMQELARTLNEARAENERWTESLDERRHAIERRGAEVQALIDRFGALAARARSIAEDTARLGNAEPEGDAQAVSLESIEQGLDALVEDARVLGRDAHDAGIPELAADANSLRQQLASARHRVELLRQKLGGAQA